MAEKKRTRVRTRLASPRLASPRQVNRSLSLAPTHLGTPNHASPNLDLLHQHIHHVQLDRVRRNPNKHNHPTSSNQFGRHFKRRIGRRDDNDPVKPFTARRSFHFGDSVGTLGLGVDNGRGAELLGRLEFGVVNVEGENLASSGRAPVARVGEVKGGSAARRRQGVRR